jgi:hypothetical protein
MKEKDKTRLEILAQDMGGFRGSRANNKFTLNQHPLGATGKTGKE